MGSVPTGKFGIVAAMSKNNVIGINGGIPWRLPRDRHLFKTLTKESIMIIGKRTFEEHPRLEHINHSRCCIVVSSTLRNIESNAKYAPNTTLKVTGSFPEALAVAEEIHHEGRAENNRIDSGIRCWVAGGQRLYEEALLHESAYEIHLSVVNIEIDFSQKEKIEAAMFPPCSIWGNLFDEVVNIPYTDEGQGPTFSYHVYRRKGNS